MFTALDYYRPAGTSPSRMPPRHNNGDDGPRRPVVSPSLSQSPTRNSGLDAARRRHKERQQNGHHREDGDDDAHHTNYDEDGYEDATADYRQSRQYVHQAAEELRSRSRPITPNRVRLSHNRSPFVEDETRARTGMSPASASPSASSAAFGMMRHSHGIDDRAADNNNMTGAADRFAAGMGVFSSPQPPSISMRPFINNSNQPPHGRIPSSPSPPMPPPSATSSTTLAMLKEVVPFLSDGFSCTEQDAQTLLSFVQSARASAALQNMQHTEAQIGSDRVASLEAQVATLTQRLERKDGDLDRVRNDVQEARGRYHALEQRFRNAQQSNASRKEENRKQLLLEEGKVSKLTHQCKNLQMEVDRLRRMLHENLGGGGGGGGLGRR